MYLNGGLRQNFVLACMNSTEQSFSLAHLGPVIGPFSSSVLSALVSLSVSPYLLRGIFRFDEVFGSNFRFDEYRLFVVGEARLLSIAFEQYLRNLTHSCIHPG